MRVPGEWSRMHRCTRNRKLLALDAKRKLFGQPIYKAKMPLNAQGGRLVDTSKLYVNVAKQKKDKSDFIVNRWKRIVQTLMETKEDFDEPDTAGALFATF